MGELASGSDARFLLVDSLACRSRQQNIAKVPDRSRTDRDVVEPKAIVNVEQVTPVSMEEVAYRLTDALAKVVLNEGAPGPDGQTVEQLREQWPIAGPRLAADLLAGKYRPGAIRRANIRKAGGWAARVGDPERVDWRRAGRVRMRGDARGLDDLPRVENFSWERGPQPCAALAKTDRTKGSAVSIFAVGSRRRCSSAGRSG